MLNFATAVSEDVRPLLNPIYFKKSRCSSVSKLQVQSIREVCVMLSVFQHLVAASQRGHKSGGDSLCQWKVLCSCLPCAGE